jgi:hypothetical protein
MNSSFFDILYTNDNDRTNIVNSQLDVVFSNNMYYLKTITIVI